MDPEDQAILQQLMGAQPNTGAVAQPQANAGNMAAAMSQVKNAIELLQQALPMLPVGNEMHEAVINAVKGLSKHMESSNQNQGMQMSGLVQMMQQMAQSAPTQQLAQAFPDMTNQVPAGMPQVQQQPQMAA